MDTDDAYLTTSAAGRYIGFTERALIEWRRTGRGPKYTRLGGPTGRVRYARADLDAFMQSRSYSHTAEEATTKPAA